MRPVGAVERELVLAGGGHAHVQALAAFAMRPVAGVRLTLVTPEPRAFYSGMLPGLVAGCYRPEECYTDLNRLAQRAGARMIRAAVTGLDAVAGRIELAGHPPLHFDCLSLNTGTALGVAASQPAVTPVKPVAGFLAAFDTILADVRKGAGPRRIVIIGGGVGAVELALAMRRRLNAECTGASLPDLAILTQHQALAGLPENARLWLKDALNRGGIALVEDAEVIGAEDGRLDTRDGRRIAFGHAFAATGAAAPYWLQGSGLALDENGFVLVDETLRSTSHPYVFAAGDITAFADHALPKSGVFAVRQGKVLARNLRSALTGERLDPFRPQRNALALIGIGCGEAIAIRGRWAAGGMRWTRALAWRLKQTIDRRWIARFKDLPAMPPLSLEEGS